MVLLNHTTFLMPTSQAASNDVVSMRKFASATPIGSRAITGPGATRPAKRSRKSPPANAAQAAGELATTAYGLVPRSIEGALVGTLVFVDPPPAPPPGEQPPPRTEASVRASRGGAAATKKIYTGQSLEDDPSQYVILVEGASSVNVLGQQANAFGQYRANLAELKTLLDKTIEIQGRLETELGQIAALSN